MYICDRCSKYGVRFERGYLPDEYLEGKPNSPVWIIGLNPANTEDWVDTRSVQDLETYFDDPTRVHSYFRDFKAVSEPLYDALGSDRGTAHTDLVKCSSMKFPPPGTTGKGATEIIKNCGGYLQAQIARHRPTVLVCNGAQVSKFIRSLFPPENDSADEATSYWTEVEGRKVCVVLSGFIGRIDNYSRRRLGIEIESRLAEAQELK